MHQLHKRPCMQDKRRLEGNKDPGASFSTQRPPEQVYPAPITIFTFRVFVEEHTKKSLEPFSQNKTEKKNKIQISKSTNLSMLRCHNVVQEQHGHQSTVRTTLQAAGRLNKKHSTQRSDTLQSTEAGISRERFTERGGDRSLRKVYGSQSSQSKKPK